MVTVRILDIKIDAFATVDEHSLGKRRVPYIIQDRRYYFIKLCLSSVNKNASFYKCAYTGLNARDAMTFWPHVLFFSVRKSFEKFHSFIDRCVYSHSLCLREIWAKFAR